jgi:23S rRNA (pseudouridine1915-N3)-methyltransferase
MRIAIAAIGRLKPGPEKLLSDDYLKRISGVGPNVGISALKLVDFAESQLPETSLRMAEEAKHLRQSLAPRSLIIALDERGQVMSSSDFAKTLRAHADNGVADVSFLIGGPDGHDPTIRSDAKLLLAFGPMTWPHRLVRLMLLEQIYRSITIMMNHPYHRS